MGSSEETGKTFEERRKEILEVLEYEEQARREEKAEILALIEQKQRRLEELDRGLVLIQNQRLDLETQAQEHTREWEKIDLLLTELSKLLPGKVILDTLLGLRDKATEEESKTQAG